MLCIFDHLREIREIREIRPNLCPRAPDLRATAIAPAGAGRMFHQNESNAKVEERGPAPLRMRGLVGEAGLRHANVRALTSCRQGGSPLHGSGGASPFGSSG